MRRRSRKRLNPLFAVLSCCLTVRSSLTSPGLAGALSFAVCIAAWPTISGGALAPRWAVMSIAVPLMTVTLRPRLTPAHRLGMAFLCYAAISLLWTPVIYDGLNSLWQLAVLAGLFCIGAELRSFWQVYIGLTLGLVGSAVIVGLQLAGIATPFSVAEATPIPAGLFVNSNFMAEIAAPVLIGMLPSPLAIIPAFLLFVTHCLSAIVAVATACLIWLWPRYRPIAATLTLVALIGVGWLGYDKNPQRYEHRIGIWGDAIINLTTFGHGAGSYYVAQAANSPAQKSWHSREEHAHNDALEIAFEYGLPGFALLAAIVVYALGAPCTRERLVLVAFLVEGLFGFPLYNPATAFLAVLLLGHLSGLRHRLFLGLADSRVHRAANEGTAGYRRPYFTGRGSEAISIEP